MSTLPRVYPVIGDMTKGELFFRLAREIFAGIMGLFQENLPKQDGKRAAFGRIDDYRIDPNVNIIYFAVLLHLADFSGAIYHLQRVVFINITSLWAAYILSRFFSSGLRYFSKQPHSSCGVKGFATQSGIPCA